MLRRLAGGSSEKLGRNCTASGVPSRELCNLLMGEACRFSTSLSAKYTSLGGLAALAVSLGVGGDVGRLVITGLNFPSGSEPGEPLPTAARFFVGVDGLTGR